MAKKGKHLSAATRQKISESVKRAAAERAKSTKTVHLGDLQGNSKIEFASVAAATNPKVRLAVDVVNLIRSDVFSSDTLVRVVDRILRP